MTIVAVACASATSPIEPTVCNGCTKQYSPVCATRLYQSRVEFKTFANDCMREYENCLKHTGIWIRFRHIYKFNRKLVSHIIIDYIAYPQTYFTCEDLILPTYPNKPCPDYYAPVCVRVREEDGPEQDIEFHNECFVTMAIQNNPLTRKLNL